jgi:hypothetical protein
MSTTTQAEGPAGRCGPKGSASRPEYRIYRGMLRRYYVPRCKEFPRYGGRSIAVCPRWLGPGGFARFLQDLGPRPFRKASINRRDNDGDYEPGNVDWADQRTQTRNKYNNHRLTHVGRTMALSAWAEKLGMRPVTLSRRLLRGWSVEEALTTPVEPRKPSSEWKRDPNAARRGRKPRPRPPAAVVPPSGPYAAACPAVTPEGGR